MIYVINILLLFLIVFSRTNWFNHLIRNLLSCIIIVILILYNSIPLLDINQVNFDNISTYVLNDKTIEKSLHLQKCAEIKGRFPLAYIINAKTDTIFDMNQNSKLYFLTGYKYIFYFLVRDGRVIAISSHIDREASYYFSGFSTNRDIVSGPDFICMKSNRKDE